MDPDLIGKVGLPIALTVVLVAFFLRTMFPYMVKQVEGAQAQTAAAIAAFHGLKETLIQQTDINKQIATQLQMLLERKP